MTISETPLCLAPVLFHIHSEFKDVWNQISGKMFFQRDI